MKQDKGPGGKIHRSKRVQNTPSPLPSFQMMDTWARYQSLVPKPIRVLLSRLYQIAACTRLSLYQQGYLKSKRVSKPVVSVGNLTLGGTGKTPFVEYLARLLQQAGYRTAVISRGYGRQVSHPLLVSDGSHILHPDPNISGDEPLLLAQHLHGSVIAVGSSRYQTIQLVEATSPCDIYLLDDGFQHLQIERTADIVLVDATNPFGDFAFPPQGTLREPVHSLARASAVVITRADRPFDQFSLEHTIRTIAPAAPIFYSYHEMTDVYDPLTGNRLPPQKLSGLTVLAVCSIGNPFLFYEDLCHFQARVIRFVSFRDHHRYTPGDVKHLLQEAERSRCQMIVTTEKDWIRLRQVISTPVQVPIYVSRIQAHLDDEARFRQFLLSHLHSSTNLFSV